VGDYTARLGGALVEAGAEVHVLTSSRGRGEDGLRLHPLVEDWTETSVVRKVFAAALDKIRPDVVQVQYPGSYGRANRSLAGNLLPWWTWERGFRVATTLHEWGERKLQWKIRAALMAAGSHALVAVTSHDARLVRSLPWVGRRPVRHVPIGANLEFERDAAGVSDLPVLAYFGFLHPLKGVTELLQAAQILKTRVVDFRLDLHGFFRPDDDRHHAAIGQQVRAAGLEHHVRFPGPVPADPAGAAAALRKAWLGVLPFREGLSERRGSFLALGRSGLPVLTSPGPWNPDWVRDGDNIFLEPLEPARWADRIERLLAAGPAGLDPVGARLRTEIVCRHSWSAIARDHLAFWNSLP
jgi:glycosyltransferase involved in cell wall biosynthesis